MTGKCRDKFQMWHKWVKAKQREAVSTAQFDELTSDQEDFYI